MYKLRKAALIIIAFAMLLCEGCLDASNNDSVLPDQSATIAPIDTPAATSLPMAAMTPSASYMAYSAEKEAHRETIIDELSKMQQQTYFIWYADEHIGESTEELYAHDLDSDGTADTMGFQCENNKLRIIINSDEQEIDNVASVSAMLIVDANVAEDYVYVLVFCRRLKVSGEPLDSAVLTIYLPEEHRYSESSGKRMLCSEEAIFGSLKSVGEDGCCFTTYHIETEDERASFALGIDTWEWECKYYCIGSEVNGIYGMQYDYIINEDTKYAVFTEDVDAYIYGVPVCLPSGTHWRALRYRREVEPGFTIEDIIIGSSYDATLYIELYNGLIATIPFFGMHRTAAGREFSETYEPWDGN